LECAEGVAGLVDSADVKSMSSLPSLSRDELTNRCLESYPRKRVPYSSPDKILEMVLGSPPGAITTAGTPPRIALQGRMKSSQSVRFSHY
jgi:hypothetical protein